MTRPLALLVLGLFAGAGAIITLTGSEGGHAPSPLLPAWIAGCWASQPGDERVHERWTVADPATLIGLGHTIKNGRMTAFEFLRVVVRNGTVAYVAQPGGVPPTEFVATSQTAARIVFENPAHDFPKRVTYERSGTDRLTASIDGGVTSRQRVEFVMTRVSCD